MGTITLEQIHEDIMGLKKEIEHLKTLVEEDFELANDVVKEIEESRNRSKEDFISHEEMGKEFR